MVKTNVLIKEPKKKFYVRWIFQFVLEIVLYILISLKQGQNGWVIGGSGVNEA